jgi:hypothetical protein
MLSHQEEPMSEWFTKVERAEKLKARAKVKDI